MDGLCDIPPLPQRITYIQPSTEDKQALLLRNDGRAVHCCDASEEDCQIPALEEGTQYVAVSCGGRHLLLLRSDGRISAGSDHAVLLRADGSAVAVGSHAWGQSGIPRLQPGLTYTQVSARHEHTVLLRSEKMRPSVLDLRRGPQIHGCLCGLPSNGVVAQRRTCSGVQTEPTRRMRRATFGSGYEVHPDCGRRSVYGASSKRWTRSALW
eukprot:s1025_g14.t1